MCVCVHMHVLVCVCVRERERERESMLTGFMYMETWFWCFVFFFRDTECILLGLSFFKFWLKGMYIAQNSVFVARKCFYCCSTVLCYSKFPNGS